MWSTSSNRIERLYKELVNNIFRSETHPFSKRLIVVPSPAMKGWLMRQMAQDFGIFAGFEIVFLDEAIQKISGKKDLFPSSISLKFSLFSKILSITQKERELPIWRPLIKFLNAGGRKKIKRLTTLSAHLSHLFLQYFRYGKKMLEDPEKLGWQGVLFERLVPKVEEQTRSFQVDEAHFFALSFLSSEQLKVLNDQSQQIPIFTYQLSPCRMYWADLLSDRETRNLEARWKKRGAKEDQQLQLEEYLRDQNPLLCNFGRLGRHMTERLEQTHISPYVIAKGAAEHALWQDLCDQDLEYSDEKLTLLRAVQADLLLLRTPTQKVVIGKDRSIQVHGAPSLMRQVEVLKNVLLGLMKDGISPQDIVVMAPDISLFSPYIPPLFDEEEIRWQVMEIQARCQNQAVSGLIHLLNLAKGRWDAASVIQLLELEIFQKKQKLSKEDVSMARSWIEEAGILWGIDPDHRNHILKEDHTRHGMVDETSVGTWQMGIERLCLAYTTRQPFDLEETEWELLGKLIGLICDLKERLSPIRDGTWMTLSEWGNCLKDLWTRYFVVKEGEDSLLLQEIQMLEGEDRFPFYPVGTHLQGVFEKERVNFRDHELNAIRFCSMLPMRAIPAKVVCLLGMDEGVFPKTDLFSSLNLLKNSNLADYCPLQTDYDRYLFLETLLSARENFIIFYNTLSLQDGKQQPPSVLVTELVNYLEKSYGFLGSCYFKHPTFGFDPCYFVQGTQLENYSESDFKAAVACQEGQKEEKNSEYLQSEAPKREELTTVLLKELVMCAKDPIKLYCQKHLGIYLEKEGEKRVKTEEEFAVTQLRQTIIKREAIKKPLDLLLEQEKNKSSLPFGLFGDRSKQVLNLDLGSTEENLSFFGLNKQDLMTLHLTEEVREPKFENGIWFLPPLVINNQKIIGKMENITSMGLLTWGEDCKKESASIWPNLLVYQAIVETGALPFAKRVLYLASKSCKELDFEDPHSLLQRFLCYFEKAIKTPSPILPEWILDFSEKQEHEISKKITLSLSSNYFYNDHLRWLKRRVELGDFSIWKLEAKNVYGPLIQKWYTR
jgi:exodeoxyribonuclease V gamma subunit